MNAPLTPALFGLSSRMVGLLGGLLYALVPGLSALGAVLWLDEPLYWNLGAGLAHIQ